jgi:hypothetical protein
MAGSKQIPDHMQWMGVLIVNLQSLEFALRAFLHNREIGRTNQGTPSFLENIAEGQEVELNAFTNYDTLPKLVKKYNREVEPKNPDLKVDAGLSRLRDALAHGRIASSSPSLDVASKLVKYSRPKPADTTVHVTDCHTLTKEWFNEEIRRVFENVKKVQQANELFGHM